MKTGYLSRGGVLALALGMAIAGAPAWSEPRMEGPERLVFHVDDSGHARWTLMLARGYLEESPEARLVIVTYGPGIDFLLLDARDKRGNPYDPAVAALVEKGVEFRVCAGTLEARDIDREEVIDVATIVPSGVAEIARLQFEEGYAYLKP